MRPEAKFAGRGGELRDLADAAELLAATARAVQIGGTAHAVLDLAVQHASERVQFGRTLDKFQAVEHLLARLAADATTISVAADAAVLALVEQAPEAEPVAAAKAEASTLALEVAKAGHQVHGAIGYTAEHRLGDHTKRLWSWRQELGNELSWHRRIAGLIDDASGQLWPLLTGTVTSAIQNPESSIERIKHRPRTAGHRHPRRRHRPGHLEQSAPQECHHPGDGHRHRGLL